MGKKKKKNNSLKVAIQAQKKKGLHTREMEKLFSDAREIIKEKEKKGHIGYPMIFNKKKSIEEKKDEVKNENNTEKESELKPYKFFQKKFRNYVFDFFDVKDLVELLMMNSVENYKNKSKELGEIVENNIIAKNDNMVVSYFDIKNYNKFRSVQNDMFLLGTSGEKIYKNFFIYILTIYENFLQDMMRIILKTYPGKLSEERSLTYDDFRKCKTVEEIQDFYIEATIADNMSGNTLEKIKKLDRLLDNNKDFKLIDILPVGDLVEINSRRNLFVHNDGIINNKYVESCKEGGLSTNGLILGEKLFINKEYFLASFYTIVETVLKIVYVVFCKCFHDKDDIDDFDNEINAMIVDYFISKNEKERLLLSGNVLQFLHDYISEKSDHNDIAKQFFIINLALCNKIQGNKEKCKNILNLRDWTQTSLNFQLANYVLLENRKKASELMKSCSCKEKENNKFRKKDYQRLPLFFEFRNTEEFKEKYKEFYGFDFYEEEDLD